MTWRSSCATSVLSLSCPSEWPISHSVVLSFHSTTVEGSSCIYLHRPRLPALQAQYNPNSHHAAHLQEHHQLALWPLHPTFVTFEYLLSFFVVPTTESPSLFTALVSFSTKMDSLFNKISPASKVADTSIPPLLAQTNGDILNFAQFEAMLGGFSRTCHRCGWLLQSDTEFAVSSMLCNKSS